MTRKLKVFTVNLDGRTYGLVAATSQQEAARLLSIPVSRLRTYGSETGNAEDCALALSRPGAVFVSPANFRSTWTER